MNYMKRHNIEESRCTMVKNRLDTLEKPIKKIKTIVNKTWCIFYKEINKLAYLTNEQLKDLLDIDKVKITGKYEEILLEGLTRKIWVDGVIVLSALEAERLKHNQAPKDYFEEEKEEI